MSTSTGRRTRPSSTRSSTCTGAGEPVDAVTVADHLTKRGQLLKLGGAPYIHDLLAAVPLAANAGFYADIVHTKATLRRLGDAATRIAQLAAAGEGEADDLVDQAQAELYAVTDRRSSQDYTPLSQLMQPVMDEIEAIGARGDMSGVPTGFADLDDLTGGLHPGQMVIVAARPGQGKSDDGVGPGPVGVDPARTAVGVLLPGDEPLEITMRLLSAEASVPLANIRSGRMSDADWERISSCMGRVSEAPMYIDDSPNLTIMEIRAKARRLKQRHDLKLMVIDYIQLMTSGKRVESRQVEVSEFSRQIKLLAKELEIPVVALSQLNRGPEQRTDKKPMLSDLRESGSLEQDADLVILLNRPDLYDKESDRAGEADFDVAKHRNGPTRAITVAFQGHYSRFADMK